MMGTLGANSSPDLHAKVAFREPREKDRERQIDVSADDVAVHACSAIELFNSVLALNELVDTLAY